MRWYDILKTRVAPSLPYFFFFISLSWIIATIIDFIIYFAVKDRRIKLHAFQASIMGIFFIVFMSIFGFFAGLFFPEISRDLTYIAGKLIGLVFAAFGLTVVFKRDVVFKKINSYI